MWFGVSYFNCNSSKGSTPLPDQTYLTDVQDNGHHVPKLINQLTPVLYVCEGSRSRSRSRRWSVTICRHNSLGLISLMGEIQLYQWPLIVLHNIDPIGGFTVQSACEGTGHLGSCHRLMKLWLRVNRPKDIPLGYICDLYKHLLKFTSHTHGRETCRQTDRQTDTCTHQHTHIPPHTDTFTHPPTHTLPLPFSPPLPNTHRHSHRHTLTSLPHIHPRHLYLYL